jgi:hypothetical protein
VNLFHCYFDVEWFRSSSHEQKHTPLCNSPIATLNLRQDAGNVGHGGGYASETDEPKRSLHYPRAGQMSSFVRSYVAKVVVAENVGLIGHTSGQSAGRNPVVGDSE